MSQLTPPPPESATKAKSFLIRDILASNSSNNTKQTVFDWILNNPEWNQQMTSVWPSATAFHSSDAKSKNKGQNGSQSAEWIIHNNQDTAHSEQQAISDSLHDQLQKRLYQNLCYAIQQQINATVISSTNTDRSSVQVAGVGKVGDKSVKRRKKPKSFNQTNDKILCSATGNTNKIRTKTHATANNLSSLEMIINLSNDIIDQSNQDQFDTLMDKEQSNAASGRHSSKQFRKIRRNRTVFTELQLMGLERRFDSQKYLSTPDRTDLARALGLTQLQVKTWYQNRRMKWKKQVMQNGCPYPPTKPKGRPKKDSIPTYGLEFTNSILCPLMANVSQQSN